MARKKRKGNRKAQAHKIVDRTIRGFWLKFEVVDPLGDREQLVNAKIGSHNPVVGARLRNQRFWDLVCQVIDAKKLKWRMKIEMEFSRKDGASEYKVNELVAFGALPDLSEVYEATIEHMFQDALEKNYVDRYVKTLVTQEVLAGHEIKDEDFTE